MSTQRMTVSVTQSTKERGKTTPFLFCLELKCWKKAKEVTHVLVSSLWPNDP